MKNVEIRVRPVIRYVVTRFQIDDTSTTVSNGGSEALGEFDNARQANRVAVALHGYEHETSPFTPDGQRLCDITLTLADE